MSSDDLPHQTFEDQYNLGLVAEHNAANASLYSSYQEGSEYLASHNRVTSHDQVGMNFYGGSSTPHSNPTTDGMRTRSGRSTRRTESPFNTDKSRNSKSPAIKAKKERKGKLDRSKMPKLTAPLSVLTKDMDVPLKDMNAWVHRSTEERQKEVERRNGYITRPMNSFMLYRSAFAERTKQWCLQNNHQIVSSVSGESWPMEPVEIRNQYDEWAKIERANHSAAHPDYKFSPSKATNKRRKDDMSDGDDELSDVDNDPDGEYRGPRSTRQRKQERREVTFQPIASQPLESHPYYNQVVAELDEMGYYIAGPGNPTYQANIGYESRGVPYNHQITEYVPSNAYQASQYEYNNMNAPSLRVPTPGSLNGTRSLGGYGLPGGHASAEEILWGSRGSTPLQTHTQYTPQLRQVYIGVPMVREHADEHQQYLQQASEPRMAIDPTLDAAHVQQNDFYENTFGELEVPQSPTDVNATLAPTWMPEEEL